MLGEDQQGTDAILGYYSMGLKDGPVVGRDPHSLCAPSSLSLFDVSHIRLGKGTNNPSSSSFFLEPEFGEAHLTFSKLI